MCEVVTRNPNHAAIRTFLDKHGAPPEAELPIRTVAKGRSKADYVLAGLAEPGEMLAAGGMAAPGVGEAGGAEAVWDGDQAGGGTTVLMVDDSVAELAEARVAVDERVHRILFVRALL